MVEEIDMSARVRKKRFKYLIILRQFCNYWVGVGWEGSYTY